MANNKRIVIGLDFETNLTEINKLKEQIKQIQLDANFARDTGKLTNELKEASKAASDLENILDSSWNSKLGQLDLSKLNKSIKESYGSLSNFRSALEKSGYSGTNLFNNFSRAVLGTNVQIKQTNKLLNEMATSMANTVKWGVTSAIFNNITNSIQKSWDYSLKLDSSLNNIRIVTGKSADEMERFAKIANNAAKDLGASTLDYTDAALIYYQQGLSEEDVQARANTTLKVANVTGQSGQSVSEQLTAVWNGYKVSAEEAELYIDKLSAVAATTAADLEELSTGMSKVAAAANTMGVDVDQLNAQLATIVSVTRQAPESVGTALKTIYARMSDIEAGIEEDGVTLGNYTDKMAQLGVNVLNAKGELRDMGEVIEEIGGNWTNLSREQQIALAQIMAGTRQYNNLIALFDNWDMYSEALNDSKNSAGELQKQQDIYMESTEAHLQKLATEAEKTYDILFDDSAVNSMASALTSLLGILNSFFAGLGGGLNAFSFIGASAANLFSNQISGAITQAKYNKEIDKVNQQSFTEKQNFQKELSNPSEKYHNNMAELFEEMSYLQTSMTTEEQAETNEQIKQLSLIEQEIEKRKRLLEIFKESRTLQKTDLDTEKMNPKQFREASKYLNEELIAASDLGQILRGQPVDEVKGESPQGNLTERLFQLSKKYSISKMGAEEWAEVGGYEGFSDRQGKEITKADIEKTSQQYLKDIQQKYQAEFKKLLKDFGFESEKASKTTVQIVRKLRDQIFAFSELPDKVSIEKMIDGAEKAIKEEENKIVEEMEEARQLYEEVGTKKTKEGKKTDQAADLKEEIDTAQKQADTGIAKLKAKFKKLFSEEELAIQIKGYTTIFNTINSLVNLARIWNDETISGGEKVTQFLTVAGAMAIQLVTNWSNVVKVFKTLKGGLASVVKSYLTMAVSAEFATEVAEKGFMEASVAAGGFGATLWTVLWPIGLIMVAIAALAAAIYGLVSAYNADANAAKEARENAKAAGEAAEEAKQAYEDLKKSLTDYDEAVKALQELDSTTQEYRDTLIEANKAAMELMKNTPELISKAKRDATGLITFEGIDLETVLNTASQSANTASGAANIAQIRSNEASLKSQRTEFIRSNKIDWFNAGTAGELKDEELLQIIEVVNKKGGITEGDLKNIVGNTQTLIRTLMDTNNKEELLELAKTTQELTDTNKLLIEETLRSGLENNTAYAKMSEAEKNAVAEIYGEGLTDKKQAEIKKKAEEFYYQDWGFGGGNEDAVQQEYAKARGWTLIDDKVGDTAVYIDKNGDETEISDDAARAYLVAQKIAKDTANYNEENLNYIMSGVQKASMAGNAIDSEIGIELMGFLTGKDTSFDPSRVNQDQIDQLIKARNSGELRKDLEKITTDEWIALDTTLLDTLTAIDKGIANFKPDWDLEYKRDKEEVKETDNIINTLSEKSAEELSEEELEYLKELEKEYEKLGEIQDRNSHEYLQVLREIQEQQEESVKTDLKNSKKAQKEKIDSLIEEIGEKKKLGIDTTTLEQELEDALKKLEETDHKIKVEIDADIKSDIDSAFDLAGEFEELKDLLTDDLTISFEEAQEIIANGYGAILQNAKETSDSTIQLDKKVTDAYIDEQQKKLNEDRLAKIEQLENQNIIAKAQLETLKKKQTELKKATEATNAADAATALAKAQYLQAEADAYDQTKTLELIADEEANKEKSEDQKRLSDFLGGIAETNADNEQKASNEADKTSFEHAKNVVDYYNTMQEAVVKFSEAVKKAATGEATLDKVTGPIKGTLSLETFKAKVAESGYQVTEKEIKTLTEQILDNAKEDVETIKAVAEEQLKDVTLEIESLEDEIGANEGAIAALKSANSSLDKRQKEVQEGSEKSELDHIERLENELDLYHDINIELEKIDKELNRLQDQQDKLLGKDLIENLNEQFNLLSKQIEKTKEKMSEMKKESDSLKTKLKEKGVFFDKDGTISNYKKVYEDELKYVNDLIDKYNAMTDEAEQKAFKETVETAKEEFELFKKNLERYEEIIEEEIPDLEDNIQEAFDKQIEIRIEKFNTEIEIRLEMAQAERDWNEFKKNVIDKIADDDILGNAKARLQDFHSYYKEGETEGAIEETTRHINDILFELGEMDRGIMSNFYGDNKVAAFEDLKKYYGQLMEDLTAVEELSKEVKQSYLDMMDKAQEDFDKQISKYEQITDLIDHDMKLIELLHGDKSYEAFDTYYKKQEKNYNQQLDFQKRQMDFWAAEMEAAKNDAERWAIAEENWSSAVTEWKSLINTAIENIQDKYLNTIKSIFEELNNKVTGDLGLEYVNEQWGLINRNAEEYLDAINAMYGIEDLQNKYLDAIDKTDSLSAQRKLNELMEQEVKALEEKDKLTQYDVDRAMKKYDIALKQIALEEAQQNKTSMRLKRDSQGNYSYQFTADEDAVRAAEDELAAAQNELYNFDKENYINNLDEIYAAWEEYQEKMFEAAQINDPEERLAREKLLNEQYGELINGLTAQNLTIRNNLYESAFDEHSRLMDKELEEYLNMTQAQKDELLTGLIPQWDSGVQHMADVFAGEGGFTEVCKEAMGELSEATKAYDKDLEQIEKSAEITFETVVDGTDASITSTGALLLKNDELIKSYKNELTAVQAVITELDKLIIKFNNARDAAIEAAEAAYDYMQTDRGDFDADDFSDTPDYSRVMTDRVQSMAGTKNYKVSEDKYIKQTMEERQQKIDRDNTVTSVDNDRFLKVLEAYTDPENEKHNDAVELVGLVDKGQLHYTKETLDKYKFNTGGYTGTWAGEAGRLALLHQKELVLNAEDTKNILNAVQVLRTIDGSVLQRLASMNGTIGAPKGNLDTTEAIEQNVHIDAQFPNVTNSHEIENAFNNLINIASQRAFRKK